MEEMSLEIQEKRHIVYQKMGLSKEILHDILIKTLNSQKITKRY